jgi:hypothetical protein
MNQVQLAARAPIWVPLVVLPCCFGSAKTKICFKRRQPSRTTFLAPSDNCGTVPSFQLLSRRISGLTHAVLLIAQISTEMKACSSAMPIDHADPD